MSNQPMDQAGSAGSSDPVEGSVEVGEDVDPTDDGQSLRVTEQIEEGGPAGESSEAPAEGS